MLTAPVQVHTRGCGVRGQGVAPYVAINFTVYETMRTWFVQWRERQPTANEKMICGALAGTAAQTCAPAGQMIIMCYVQRLTRGPH